MHSHRTRHAGALRRTRMAAAPRVAATPTLALDHAPAAEEAESAAAVAAVRVAPLLLWAGSARADQGVSCVAERPNGRRWGVSAEAEALLRRSRRGRAPRRRATSSASRASEGASCRAHVGEGGCFQYAKQVSEGCVRCSGWCRSDRGTDPPPSGRSGGCGCTGERRLRPPRSAHGRRRPRLTRLSPSSSRIG